MQVTQFSINNLRTEINLTIIDAATVDTLLLFTNKNYKDYNKALNLSSKLTGSATENITITLSDLNIPFFDGLYFIEVEDSDEISQAISSDLTRYKECIIEKINELRICDSCLKEEALAVLNSHQVLVSLEDSIDQGLIEESFNFIKMLDKHCSNGCTSCGEYSNITNNNYYSTPIIEPASITNIKGFYIKFQNPLHSTYKINVVQQGKIVISTEMNVSEQVSIGEISYFPIEVDINKSFRMYITNEDVQIMAIISLTGTSDSNQIGGELGDNSNTYQIGEELEVYITEDFYNELETNDTDRPVINYNISA